MSLLMISEIMEEKQELLGTLADYEKEFVVQFAFKTSDQELTGKLIQELAEARDGDETKQIMQKYTAVYDQKPLWVNQIENLLVSIEIYRVEQERAITRLSQILGAYGIDVSEEELRTADAETIKAKVSESQKEEEELQEEDEKKTSIPEQKPFLRQPAL